MSLCHFYRTGMRQKCYDPNANRCISRAYASHESCHLGRMLPAEFGARLRERREAQQIELSAIAEQTKIKRSLLEALERDDLSHWPSGIFRRAWLRSYAKAIGLDPDATVREFLEAHPDPEDIPVLNPASPAGPTQSEGDHGSSARWGIVGAALGTFSRRMRGPAQEASGIDPRPIIARPIDVEPPATEANTAPASPKPSDEAGPAASPKPMPPEFDLPAVARICTQFGQVGSVKDVQPLLQEIATILEATGLIVWLWNSTGAALRPVLVHGYSAGVIARLPAVKKDADNPTAASFRTGQMREIDGGDSACGALVVPLLLRSRCIGVLAIELPPNRKLSESGRCIAVILAAALTQLVSRSSQAAEVRHSPSKRGARLSPIESTI